MSELDLGKKRSWVRRDREKRVTADVVKHGNLKLNSITGMLSEVF